MYSLLWNSQRLCRALRLLEQLEHCVHDESTLETAVGIKVMLFSQLVYYAKERRMPLLPMAPRLESPEVPFQRPDA